MRRFAILIISCCFLFCCLPVRASADPITLSQVSAAAFAVASAWGVDFSVIATPENLNSYMENQVNKYLAGQSIAEKFGTDFMRVTAGKLVVAQTGLEAIKELWQDIFASNGVDLSGDNDFIAKSVVNGYEYAWVDAWPTQAQVLSNVQFSDTSSVSSVGYSAVPSGYSRYIYYNGVQKLNWSSLYQSATVLRYMLYFEPGAANPRICISTSPDNPSNPSSTASHKVLGYQSAFDVDQYKVGITAQNPMNWGTLSSDQEGVITNNVSDFTSLEDVESKIFDGLANNDISLDGSIEGVAPVPTPIPPYPPAEDVMEGINTGISIGNDIIAGQREQTGAVTQAGEGVIEAVGSLEGTIEAIADTPTTEELPDFKFDLRELFPFCIPFDIYRLLSSFDAEPAAPHVQIPIVIDSINFRYNLDLDFSSWNPVAQAMRTAELIVYAIGLAWATGKVIKW